MIFHVVNALTPDLIFSTAENPFWNTWSEGKGVHPTDVTEKGLTGETWEKPHGK